MSDTNAGYKYWRRIPETLPTDAGPRAPRGPRRATHQRAVRQQHHHPRADEPNKLLSSSHYTFPNALHFSCFPHLGSQARNFPGATPVIHQFYANTARRTAAGTVHCATRCIPRMRVPRGPRTTRTRAPAEAQRTLTTRKGLEGQGQASKRADHAQRLVSFKPRSHS